MQEQCITWNVLICVSNITSKADPDISFTATCQVSITTRTPQGVFDVRPIMDRSKCLTKHWFVYIIDLSIDALDNVKKISRRNLERETCVASCMVSLLHESPEM